MSFKLRFSHVVLGKTEFGADEDAHVVGDCVKVLFFGCLMSVVRSMILFDLQFVQYSSKLYDLQHVLRELPSSPVPASCCTALLEAYSKSYFSLSLTLSLPPSLFLYVYTYNSCGSFLINKVV